MTDNHVNQLLCTAPVLDIIGAVGPTARWGSWR